MNVSSYDLTFNVVAGRADSGPRVEITLGKKDVEEPLGPQVRTRPFGEAEVADDE